jgi:hypothetical protein
MNLFVFGDGAITRNDAVFRHFFRVRVILHHQTKQKNSLKQFHKKVLSVLKTLYIIAKMFMYIYYEFLVTHTHLKLKISYLSAGQILINTIIELINIPRTCYMSKYLQSNFCVSSKFIYFFLRIHRLFLKCSIKRNVQRCEMHEIIMSRNESFTLKVHQMTRRWPTHLTSGSAWTIRNPPSLYTSAPDTAILLVWK